MSETKRATASISTNATASALASSNAAGSVQPRFSSPSPAPRIDLSSLNDAQRKIATTLDEPLFVEAGAGSGKTFTLTRRIVWALSPGSGKGGEPFLDDLSQVLVITFTEAAASEILERVRSSLRESGMLEAALQVDNAWISTIHGMCQRILRRNALELGIDPAFGVADSHRQEELMDIAVERALGSARREARQDSSMAQAFEAFEYNGVESRVRALVRFAHAQIDGFDGLIFHKGGGVPDAMASLTRTFEALGTAKLSAAARKAVDPSLEALRSFQALPPGSRTADRAAVALESCKPPRSSKAIVDLVAEARAELNYARALVSLDQAAAFAPALVALARHVDECYAQIKRSQALLDYDDLVGLALDAVRYDPVVAQRYAGRFKLVMVDEFQDTDEQQLELISVLAGGSLFQGIHGEGDPKQLATVGDAQQSIYRFRGADVEVFRRRGRVVPARGHVRLDVNYRSHKDVLSFVDAVCGGERGVLADFMHLDANPRRKDGYRARGLPRVSVEITSNLDTNAKAQDRTMQLAGQVADRLASYRDAGQPAGDMALLLGATSNAALYIDALRERGLECVVTGGSTFTKAPEVGVMLSLLRTLAHPHDTQAGLFPLLSSEMFELDANDFLQLGSRRQEKLDAPTKRMIDRGFLNMEFFGDAVPSFRLQHAHDVLVRALLLLTTRPVADVCLEVVRSSGWLSRLEAQGPEGVAREANVLAAVRYIRELTDELGLGPVRAAYEFAHWLEVTKAPPASLAGAEQDTVRIMTIHASKGLEYPVVAVAECWNNPRNEAGLLHGATEDAASEVIVLPKGGVKLDGADEAATVGSIVAVACGLREHNRAADDQEKARLLYVALTRAREALVLAMNVSTSKQGGSSTLAAGVTNALFGGELPQEGECALNYGGTEPAIVRHVVAHDEEAQHATATSENGALRDAGAGSSGPEEPGHEVALYPAEDAWVDEVMLARPREDVFSYSSALTNVRVVGTTDEARVRKGRSRPILPPREKREAQAAGEPTVADEDKATNLGSAFHTIAQAMVESRGELSEGQVDAICQRWMLSSRQRSRLDAALAWWRTSDVRREALTWSLVRAEVPFFALSGGSPHGTYVEGAIDLLCTRGAACEGPALVVDYKTGDLGLDEEQVRERHAAQAELYASVLLSLGFASVECAFACVETGLVVRYEFEGRHS